MTEMAAKGPLAESKLQSNCASTVCWCKTKDQTPRRAHTPATNEAGEL